jgi:phosphohistidine phosphatase SixA
MRFMAALPAIALLAMAPAKSTKGAAPAPHRIEPAVPNAASAMIPVGADSALVDDLRHGGYIIFFRHCMTNWNERDQAEPDFSNRSLQRNLSEAGAREAAMIGQSVRSLEIPIEKVLTSPMWRCRDTAQYAFGEYDTTGMLFWKGPVYREARIKMLSTPPAAGKNLVLIGHQDQFIPIVPGLKRDQLQEGDALVIKPLGGGKFRTVRQVTPFQWAKLAGVAVAIPAPSAQGMPAETDTTGSHVIEKN